MVGLRFGLGLGLGLGLADLELKTSCQVNQHTRSSKYTCCFGHLCNCYSVVELFSEYLILMNHLIVLLFGVVLVTYDH